MEQKDFYQQAFSRNIGLLSPAEQQKLHQSSVGIAGLGGVGGGYALTLARMGVGRFVIADFDTFDYANINRQAGANIKSIHQPKVDVIKSMIQEINPYAQVVTFNDGVTEQNIDQFLEASDIVVDAIDFFSMSSHLLLHSRARQKGKITLFSVPVGQSGTLQVFHPQKMSFESYHDINPTDDLFLKLCKLGVGMAPAGLHLKYLKFDPESLLAKRPTSLASACSLANGLMANSVMLLLLGKFSESYFAPFYVQMDAFTMKAKTGRLRWGNRGLLQKIKLAYLMHELKPYRAQFNRQSAENKELDHKGIIQSNEKHGNRSPENRNHESA